MLMLHQRMTDLYMKLWIRIRFGRVLSRPPLVNRLLWGGLQSAFCFITSRQTWFRAHGPPGPGPVRTNSWSGSTLPRGFDVFSGSHLQVQVPVQVRTAGGQVMESGTVRKTQSVSRVSSSESVWVSPGSIKVQVLLVLRHFTCYNLHQILCQH